MRSRSVNCAIWLNTPGGTASPLKDPRIGKLLPDIDTGALEKRKISAEAAGNYFHAMNFKYSEIQCSNPAARISASPSPPPGGLSSS
jgi:hypothetical protein